MPWISVHQEVDGTKLRRLYRAIGCSKFEALGILNFLWFWGMKNADETGLVKDADLEVLSRYLYGCGEDCQLDMGKVVQALVDTGWIDVVADGFYIHDWDTWQEQWYADITGPDWYLDEVGSSYEEEDVLECFCAELRKLCPSFQPAANSNVWLGNERRVILENELFYICVEDNEWSLAVELVQKDGYSDCESAWMAGLQKRRYRGYLDSMKKALLARLPSIGIRTGAWTSGTITREEAGVC